jgi:tRNA threonylcarbamoyladenosine biosynthesis protein TsaE
LPEYPSTIISSNEEETKSIAADFIAAVKPGDRIVLNGNLGAGKTFFIKAALSSLGITNVNSPSFAIVNEYNDGNKFYHFDFYRLKSPQELFDIGWLDYLNDDNAVMFVEWGNLMPSVLTVSRYEININIINDFKREFNFLRYE